MRALGTNNESEEHAVDGPGAAAPAVQAAPPLAIAVLADLARGANVVGNDAIVGLDAVDPALHVVQHPLLVLLFACVEVSVRDEGRRAKVARLVALERHLVEQVDYLLSAGGFLVPARLQLLDRRMEEGGGQRLLARVVLHLASMPKVAHQGRVEPVTEQVNVVRHVAVGVDYAFVLTDREHRPGAAMQWRADDAVLRVPVRRIRVLADVHVSELPRPFPVRWVSRVRDPEVVEHLVALAHVEPVGVEGDVQVPVLVAKLGHVHGVGRVAIRQHTLLAVEPSDSVPLSLGYVEEPLVSA